MLFLAAVFTVQLILLQNYSGRRRWLPLILCAAALLHLLVDAAVHSGPKRAVQWLQSALGVAADGVIGPKTRAALAAADQGVLYGKVLGQRLRHLGRLITNDPEQSAFAAGWMNRMAEFVEGTV